MNEEETSYFERRRTLFSLNNKGVNLMNATLGLIIYIIIFVIIIPYFLIKNGFYNILTAYFPNLDMLATVLGYMGGPPNKYIDDLWRYLYNPSTEKLFGFISSTIINYFALLGLTFIIAYTTYKTKSISKGWSRAFFMIILTYLIPGNFIVKLQNTFGKWLHSSLHLIYNTTPHYIAVVIAGLIFSIGIIGLESLLIKNFASYIANIIKITAKRFYIELN